MVTVVLYNVAAVVDNGVVRKGAREGKAKRGREVNIKGNYKFYALSSS